LSVGDQPQILGDLAQERTGTLLLFIQRDLQLIVSDEAQVDKNLTESTSYHEANPKKGLGRSSDIWERRDLILVIFELLLVIGEKAVARRRFVVLKMAINKFSIINNNSLLFSRPGRAIPLGFSLHGRDSSCSRELVWVH
jgi:hypothetical protein